MSTTVGKAARPSIGTPKAQPAFKQPLALSKHTLASPSATITSVSSGPFPLSPQSNIAVGSVKPAFEHLKSSRSTSAGAANFFSQLLFRSQGSPADMYNPDMNAVPPALPTQSNDLYKTAAEGVRAAIADGIQAVEVDFPPNAGTVVRGEDSKANALAAAALKRAISPLGLAALLGQGQQVFVIGCNSRSMAALRDACGEVYDLDDGAEVVASNKDAIAIVVQPSGDDQWKAATALRCRCVVVLNGLMVEGSLPQAYYYKPLTAFSAVTGGVVRRYPGPYTAYAADGRQLDLEIGLTTMGNRALPQLNAAQQELMSSFKRR